MAQGLHLSQRLTQSLVLAPQLQQSLALLQAPTLELKALVEQELQQNPVLEETATAETESLDKETDEAEKAFAKIVSLGLATNSLSVKFLFRPGSLEFLPDPKVSGPYAMWLRLVAPTRWAPQSRCGCSRIARRRQRRTSPALQS